MDIKIGDYVTRNSYNNDTIFKVIDYINDKFILKGVDIRLYADAPLEDLILCEYVNKDEEFIDKVIVRDDLDRSEYFYLPAKILHIDGDKDYLNRCLNFYKNANVFSIGEYVKENDISQVLPKLLKKYKPDILII